MEIEIWQIWIIVTVILFIVEIFIPTFFAASLAIGSLAAAIFSFLGFGTEVQLIVFSLGTLASFFAIRPFMLKYAHRKNGHVETNVDALIGKTAKVIVAIDNSKNEGRVIFEGDNWRAETENNEIVEPGRKVEILKVDSTVLIVKPLN